MKAKGIEETCLQLLQNVSGMFRPGVLTALVGVSGAGKTTLMNVLAERKIGGYTDESIIISDYPKPINFCSNKCYCEKNYIHSPHVTVYESLIYLAWLCFSPYVKMETRKMFLSEEAIDDVWLVASYLSNADFLRSSLTENLSRDCGAENIIQLAYFSCCRGTNCTRS